ncbi:MAG: Clp1/GlmU family protein [Candidatus Bathyarchaeia archaeon]
MTLKTLSIRKKSGEPFIVEGPSSVHVISGEVSSLGASFHPGSSVVIPEFKSMPFIVEEDCELEVKLPDESRLIPTQEYLPGEWVELAGRLEGAEGCFKVVVLGDTDSGKSTLTTFLANRLICKGRRVAVVDADTGQKNLGPPTTIGMKVLVKPTPILSEEAEDSAFFIGSTSPAGLIDRSVAGVLFLVSEALKGGAEVILIDTTGWIYGSEARELKTLMVTSLKPEFLIAIQRSGELEPLIKPFIKTSIQVIRVPAPKNIRRRSRSERKALRSRVFRRYLRGGRMVNLSMDDAGILYSFTGSGRLPDKDRMDMIQKVLGERPLYCEEAGDSILLVLGESANIEDAKLKVVRYKAFDKEVKVLKENDFKNVLCGLIDAECRFLGLGVIEKVDFKSRKLRIYTKVEESRIAAIQVGSMKVTQEGAEE